MLEGRDIGTVVLKDAELKLFLTARPQIRAVRRAKQLERAGIECDLGELEKEIVERDRKDSTREDSPLKQADDAILIDNSDETLSETLERVVRIAEKCVVL